MPFVWMHGITSAISGSLGTSKAPTGRPFRLPPLHLGSQCSSGLTWRQRPPLFPLLLSESFGRYGSFGRRDGLDSPGGSSQLQDAVGRLGIFQLRPSSNCCPRQWRSLQVASTTVDPNAGPLGVVKPGLPIQRWAAVAGPGPSPLSLLVKPGPPTQPLPHAVESPESLSLHSPGATVASSPQAPAGSALPLARCDSGRWVNDPARSSTPGAIAGHNVGLQ
jgi:hypothetical protein